MWDQVLILIIWGGGHFKEIIIFRFGTLFLLFGQNNTNWMLVGCIDNWTYVGSDNLDVGLDVNE